MEREVGGGIGMGKTCNPKAVSFQCMTKFTTNNKKKRKEKKKKVKEESEKVDLKLNIQKTKIMASGSINSWQIDGETVADFFGGAPKSLQMMTAAVKLKDVYSLEGKL